MSHDRASSLTPRAEARNAADIFRDLSGMPFVGMCMTAPLSKRWLHVNDALCEMLGYDRAEMLERTWVEMTHPDDLHSDLDLFEQLMRGERDGYKLGKRFVHRSGRVVHTLIDVQGRRDATGAVEFILSTIMDVSDRVAAESKAREAEALLERLSEYVPGVIYQYLLRPDGSSCFPYSSRGMSRIYGYEPEDLRDDATRVFERLHPDDFDKVTASIQKSVETLDEWTCTYRVMLPGVGVRWANGRARPERLADGSVLWHGFLSDITETEAAHRALADSEANARFLIEHAPESLLVVDAECNRIVDLNTNACQLFGYSREELLDTIRVSLVPETQPDGRSRADVGEALVQRALGGATVTDEITFVHQSGALLPTEVRVVRLPVTGRSLLRVSIMDIRERLESRRTLARLQLAIDSSLSGVALADPDGTLRYVNRAFLELWGYRTKDDVIGRSALEFWQEPASAALVVQALAEQGHWSGDLRARRLDGELRIMTVNASSIRTGDGEDLGMLASFIDVTESRHLQEVLTQSQKLESVGRLAGGVAHDFNNLLTVIKASLDLAYSELPEDSMARADLQEVARATDSAARLTQQLLAFSRKQTVAPTTLNLNNVVQRVSAMLQRLLGEDISLRTSTAHDLGNVLFDAGQAEQVLVNLAVNARDAMPMGGTLTIETRNVDRHEAMARSHPTAQPIDYVLLTVTDTGQGMSDEVLAHAFEPFYTTKQPGKGTGLGLAVIHGVVTQNGGRIDVSSTEGQGTTFRIYLPRIESQAAESLVEQTRPLPCGDERILLVEDDLGVRNLITRLLAQQGYRVHAFGDGESALKWLAQESERIDLLLTDVIMPGMNGKQLAEAVCAIRPGTPVLFASGYTANVIEPHGVIGPAIPFLAKPFSAQDLAVMVRETLDQAVTSSSRPAS